MRKGYLGDHPQIYRKINTTVSPQRYSNSLQPVNMEEMAEQFIVEEKERIYDLQMRIKAYEIKIKEEKSINLDHSAQIQALQQQVKMIRREESDIVEQINNCRKVENQVAPMEYYLWKKKQRINTFDASIAQLCRQVEQQREYLERSIQEHRRLNEQYFNQIEQLQQKIANFNASHRSSINPLEAVQSEELEELFAQNIALKQEINSFSSTNSILQENRQIVGMQVVDNIDSMVVTIKAFYEQQKTKLARQFKQVQAEAKAKEVSPLTPQQKSYTIDPLVNDYVHKMSEMLAAAPEEVRKYIQPVLQPLPWKSFNWSQFLEINSSSQNIYDQYTRLEKQFISTQKETESLQAQMRRINSEIANQHQKYNEIVVNISKLKKKLQK